MRTSTMAMRTSHTGSSTGIREATGSSTPAPSGRTPINARRIETRVDGKTRGMAPNLAAIVEAAAEVVTPDELAKLVAKVAAGERPRAYIGFEPSGTAHVGWMVCTDMVRRLSES